MILDKHDCYRYFFELKQKGEDIDSQLTEFMSSGKITKSILNVIDKNYDIPVKAFYERLNNKSHKVIKEILTCENKPVGNYVKMATSIITQAIICIEHDFANDVVGSNKFIECLKLAKLSDSLSEYFNSGNYSPLVHTIHELREDIKLVLD